MSDESIPPAATLDKENSAENTLPPANAEPEIFVVEDNTLPPREKQEIPPATLPEMDKKEEIPPQETFISHPLEKVINRAVGLLSLQSAGSFANAYLKASKGAAYLLTLGGLVLAFNFLLLTYTGGSFLYFLWGIVSIVAAFIGHALVIKAAALSQETLTSLHSQPFPQKTASFLGLASFSTAFGVFYVAFILLTLVLFLGVSGYVPTVATCILLLGCLLAGLSYGFPFYKASVCLSLDTTEEEGVSSVWMAVRRDFLASLPFVSFSFIVTGLILSLFALIPGFIAVIGKISAKDDMMKNMEATASSNIHSGITILTLILLMIGVAVPVLQYLIGKTCAKKCNLEKEV